ncbi:UbiA family prenyltransferase [Vibrio metschnikovii]|uniref:UbiA family prenyltransferase n=1 Tax=Vibrio metschnikovii TaxID=28172 RepID=A0A9X0UKP6_VIBME|nr:UbiA family prenyltransferase [Vibrio metschnikovii]MBC5853249.1 UbiA family prenyltransferase [Vibrio metschnikovii]
MRLAHIVKCGTFFSPLLLCENIDLIYTNLFSLEVLSVLFFFIVFHGNIYILNDINDIYKDRAHPLKKNRPLASGELKLVSSIIFIAFTTIFIFNLSIFESSVIIGYALSYLSVFIFYNAIGKKIIFIDGILLLIMFFIRLYYGSLYFSIYLDASKSIIIFSILSILIVKKRISESKISESYRFENCALNYSEAIIFSIYSLSILYIAIQYIFFGLDLSVSILFLSSITIIKNSNFETDNLILEIFKIKYPLIISFLFYLYLI